MSLRSFCGVIALFLSLGAQAQPKCAVQDSQVLGHSVNWCFERSRPEIAPSPGEAVVYFMHGSQGSAQSWVLGGYSEGLQNLRSQGNYPPVTFVSFDTSGFSFFSDVGGCTSGPQAYETWFITEFIPYIENTLKVCNQRQCRALAGVSMGGFGALKTALRHSQLFSSVAVNSPALPPFNFFESDERWKDYFGKHPIGPVAGMFLLAGVRAIFGDRDTADRQDPSWLVETFGDASAFPGIFFDVGDGDEFGFQEGYARFKAALDKRGFPYEAHVIPQGNHAVVLQRTTYPLRFLGAKLAGTWGGNP